MRAYSTLVFGLLFAGAACTDNNDSYDYPDLSYSFADVGPKVEVGNDGVTFSAGYDVRVDELQFVGPPASDLNGLVALNLDLSLDDPIILLYRFTGLDSDAGTPMLVYGPGTKTGMEQTYEFSDRVGQISAPLDIDPASGEFSARFERYRFVGTIEFEGTKQVVDIPLEEVEISGVLDVSEDGESASVPSGRWDGYLTKEDADNTTLTFTDNQARPLTELFRESTLNYDSGAGREVEPGSGDSWAIRAQFIATDVTVRD